MLFDKMTIGKMSFADAWAGVFSTIEADKVFDKIKEEVTIDWENGKTIKMSGQAAIRRTRLDRATLGLREKSDNSARRGVSGNA